MTTGVVLAREGSPYRVDTDAGQITAVLGGKLKHRDDDRVVAGDLVDLAPAGDGAAVITGIRPRKSVLARRVAAGGRTGRRAPPIAAKLDQVVVVTAAPRAPPKPPLLDRPLVVAA